MRRLRLTLLLPLALLAAGGFLFYRAFAPYQGFAGQTFVDIPRGTSTEGIAALLAQAGVVRSRWDFLAGPRGGARPRSGSRRVPLQPAGLAG